MVADPKFTNSLTPAEYLAWEEEQPDRYGYIDGEVYAMTGRTIPHAAIALNLASALKIRLRGTGCRVFGSDAKVGVSENGPFHYPDVIVTCDARDKNAIQAIYHPRLIVEVLSPSTERFDRGDKFQHNRRIDTLREYVLINSDKINVECYRINDRGKWELTVYEIGENGLTPDEVTIELSSVTFQATLATIYEDVDFERGK
jgi:Uma2 family endonuclease